MLTGLLERAKPGEAIASMGYPDIVYPPEKLEALLDGRKGLKYREDSDAICRRHGASLHEVPDSESFFELFGLSLDVYDIVQERGDEILCDLNYPLPQRVCQQYEHVLDVGTAEHCFNVAQALVNMACLVKVGGHVFHENPFNWGNHGFYNLNPTLFHDFYTDNGFEIVECKLLERSGEMYEAPRTKRFQFFGKEANIFTIAKRLEVREISMPTQTKYRKAPLDRGVSHLEVQ